MLELKGKPCLIVGGGEVACRKVYKLLEAQACPYVIAPQVKEELKNLALQGKIIWYPRRFFPGDTAGFYLIVAATSNLELNAFIAREAKRGGKWVNQVTEGGKEGNFIFPAIIRKGDLIISISSGGASPAYVKRLKEKLENFLDLK